MHNLWRAEGREVLSFTKLFPRFFTFLPGIPGFCQVIPPFCDVWDGKKNVTKRVFCFKKSHLLTKMEVFKDILMVCRGFDIAGISPPVGSVLWA